MTSAWQHSGRRPAEMLAAVGAVSLAALSVLVIRQHDADGAAAALPALAFFTSGLIGARARPDHRGVRLLLGVGTTHLAAFAATGWIGASGATGWAAWAVALAGDAAYLAGFVLLALLVAAYPTGRVAGRALRALALGGTAFALVGLVLETTLHDRLGLALETTAASVRIPAAVRLGTAGPSLVGFTPALVAVGLGILLIRGRRQPEQERASLGWATLAASGLVLMLAATPAAVRLLPLPVWNAAFVIVVSLVPFALLAGLVRYRLLQVDVYVVRTVARGAVVVVVLSAYALAQAVPGGRYRLLTAVLLTVAAALTGMPMVRRLQALGDRWLTGGRVGSRTALHDLAVALTVQDATTLGERIARSLADGLEIAWVRLRVHAAGVALVGSDGTARPEASVPLRTGSAEIGVLECGPRRGGWGREERAELEAIATPVALALQEVELTRELGARVAELTASRARLAEAEQTVRRQVERDLHDGAQQHLVALLARLGLARAQLPAGSPAADALDTAHELAQQCLRELRDLVTGLHPAVLGARGLCGAVEARAALLPIPVIVDADPRIADTRFSEAIESAAFFVVSEALTNVLKHSGSDHARVVLAPLDSGGLRVAVSDEGCGTTSFDGSGLTGLRDRVDAVGGRLLLHATPSVGTTVVAEFPAADLAEAPAVAGV